MSTRVPKVVDKGFLKGLALAVGVPALVFFILGLLFRPPSIIYVHAVPVWATPVVEKNITININEDYASWATLYCNVSSNMPINIWLARASDYFSLPMTIRLDASMPNYTITTGWGVLIDNSSVAYIEQAIFHVYGNNISFAVNLTKGKYILFIGASQPNAVIEMHSCFIAYNVYTTGPSLLEQFLNRILG